MSNKFAESYGNHYVHSQYENDRELGALSYSYSSSSYGNPSYNSVVQRIEEEKRAANRAKKWNESEARQRWLKKVDERHSGDWLKKLVDFLF